MTKKINKLHSFFIAIYPYMRWAPFFYLQNLFQLIDDVCFNFIGDNLLSELLNLDRQKFEASVPCQFIAGQNLAELKEHKERSVVRKTRTDEYKSLVYLQRRLTFLWHRTLIVVAVTCAPAAIPIDRQQPTIGPKYRLFLQQSLLCLYTAAANL